MKKTSTKKTSPKVSAPITVPKKKGMLYQSPQMVRNGDFKPRNLQRPQDFDNYIQQAGRDTLISYCRDLYGSMGLINGAISQKSSWAFSSAWNPIYLGQDVEWGKTAMEWLINWMNVCNVKGQPFNFRSCLELASISLDIDGDSLMILTEGQNGFPLLSFLEGHRVGQRDISETIVKYGPYEGYKISQGVIKNDLGRAVAYRVLGDKIENDIDLSAKSAHLLFEPEHFSTTRGIPRLASSILDAVDAQDIDDYLKLAVKVDSSIVLLHENETGEADRSAGNIGMSNVLGECEDTSAVAVDGSAPAYERLDGGTMLYFKTGTGGVKPYSSNRPQSNTVDFINRIERRVLYNLGWPIELLDPSKVGGASVRLVVDQARKNISARQDCIETYAKIAVNYAISRAMKLGYIPVNNTDFYKWSFTRPKQIQTDEGYEHASDINDIKMGLNSMSAVAEKYGKRGVDVRNEILEDNLDIIEKAKLINKQHPEVSFNFALNLMSQRGPNVPLNITTQPVE